MIVMDKKVFVMIWKIFSSHKTRNATLNE